MTETLNTFDDEAAAQIIELVRRTVHQSISRPFSPRGGGNKPNDYQAATTCKARNDAGQVYKRGEVIGLGDPLASAATDGFNKVVWGGEEATEQAHANSFGVVLDGAADGGFLECAVSGWTYATVNVTDAGHTTCGIKDGQKVLQSGLAGASIKHAPGVGNNLECVIAIEPQAMELWRATADGVIAEGSTTGEADLVDAATLKIGGVGTNTVLHYNWAEGGDIADGDEIWLTHIGELDGNGKKIYRPLRFGANCAQLRGIFAYTGTDKKLLAFEDTDCTLVNLGTCPTESPPDAVVANATERTAAESDPGIFTGFVLYQEDNETSYMWDGSGAGKWLALAAGRTTVANGDNSSANVANSENDIEWSLGSPSQCDLTLGPTNMEEITIDQDGDFKFSVAARVNGDNRVELILRTYIDTGSGFTQDNLSLANQYALRDSDQDKGIVNLVYVWTLNQGDKIKFSIEADADGTTVTLVDNGTYMIVEQLR